jgi:tRNA dimethylallyltransferase
MPLPRAVLIAGPTASGKSGLATAMAQEFGGIVVNADSMQVYRDLSVITARPGASELARAPHALYGHVPGSQAYSTGRWITDVRRALADAEAHGRLPVIVGGTGLYFKALLEGLPPIPDIPGDVRAHWRAEVDQLGAQALHAVLAQRDPEMAARLNANDPQRIVRALEVLEATGRSLAHWQALPGEPVLAAETTRRLCVVPDRALLFTRCDQRFDAMLAAGALDEVARLAARDLDPSLPLMRALGVPPLLAHLRGDLALADAVARAKTETRQYAKRQMTWLRGNMMSWNQINEQFNVFFPRSVFAFVRN